MRRAAGWAVAGGVVGMALALVQFEPYLFTGGDNAQYYALTRALATGRGYVDLMGPRVVPEVVYPPGYPILLVPFYWLFSGNIVGLKLASWVAGAVVLWGVYSVGLRDRAVPTWAAVAAVWLVGLYVVFTMFTHWVLSDMTFLAVVMVALWAFQRAAEDDDGNDRGDCPWGWWTAACVTAVFAYYVRGAGLTLLVAMVAWPLFHRQWRRLAVAATIAVIGMAPWYLWSRQDTGVGGPGDSGSYIAQMQRANRLDPESAHVSSDQVWNRALDSLNHYATSEFPRMFWPDGRIPISVEMLAVVIGGSLLFAGVGVLLWRRRRWAVWELYTWATVALLLAWPWTGDRFFMTVVPLFWLAILTGLDGVVGVFTSRRWPAWVLAGALTAMLAVGSARQVPAQWERTRAYLDGDEFGGYLPFWVDYFQAALWIGRSAPDAVVSGRKPTLLWYWSQQPSLVFPFHGDWERTWRFFRENGITHLVIEQRTRDFLEPMLREHIDEIELVYSGPNRIAAVLRIKPEE